MFKISSGVAYVVYEFKSSSQVCVWEFKRSAEVVFRTSSGTAKIRPGPAFGGLRILVYIYYTCRSLTRVGLLDV